MRRIFSFLLGQFGNVDKHGLECFKHSLECLKAQKKNATSVLSRFLSRYARQKVCS